jgi:chromosome segregation ATPase
MSGERETIDLAYIGRALQRLADDVAGLRDDMRVVTASVVRHERMLEHHEQFLRDMVREISALVRRHDRDMDRLRMVEDRADHMEDRHRDLAEQLRAIDAKLDEMERKP